MFLRRLLATALGLSVIGLAMPAAAEKGLGLNVHQSADVGLDVTAAATLGWVRIDLNWLDVAPVDAGSPDYARFDALVDGALARGLSVLAVVGYGPTWASSGDTLGDGPVNDVPIDGAYAPFVTDVVQHFAGRVTHYELWNEPNLDVFFEGSVDDYLSRVLVPGADAVHAACAECRVVGPSLATIGDDYGVFFDAVLAAAADRIDIVSGHAYAGFPEDGPGSGSTSDSFYNKLESHRILEVGGTVVYEGQLSMKEVMDARGVQKPFWLTEAGREAVLGDATEEANQTRHYRRVLEAMLSRPWWETTIFYEAFDEPASGYTWGVAVHDPAAPPGYVEKDVMGFLRGVVGAQPAFGGDGADCLDGLDNDGDGAVDWPADPGCTSALAVSEEDAPGEGGGGAGAAGAAPASSATETDESACGCRVVGEGSSPAGGLGAAALAVLWARRRTRGGRGARAGTGLLSSAASRGRRSTRPLRRP